MQPSQICSNASDWPLTHTQAHNRCLNVAGLSIWGSIFYRAADHMRPYLTWTFTLQASPFSGTDQCHRWRPGIELLTEYLRVSGWVFVLRRSPKVRLQIQWHLKMFGWRSQGSWLCQIHSNSVYVPAKRYSSALKSSLQLTRKSRCIRLHECGPQSFEENNLRLGFTSLCNAQSQEENETGLDLPSTAATGSSAWHTNFFHSFKKKNVFRASPNMLFLPSTILVS